MITKNSFFVLPLLVIFSTTALFSMEKDQQDAKNDQPAILGATQNNLKDDLSRAKKEFYEQQVESNKAMQNLQENINGLSGHTQRAAITKAIDLAGIWTDRSITTAFNEFRKKNGLLTEDEEITLQINRELLDSRKKENILTESTTATKKAEQYFYDSQRLNAEIEAAIRLCQNKPSHDKKCGELIENLFKKLEEQSKN